MEWDLMDEDLSILYKRKERETPQYEDALKARDTLRYIANTIECDLGMDIIGPIQWRHKFEMLENNKDWEYDYQLETPNPEECPIGLIRVLELTDIDEKVGRILLNPWLKPYKFCIIKGSDTKGGFDYKGRFFTKPINEQDYKLSLSNGGWKPNSNEVTWKNYAEFSRKFLEVNESIYRELEIDPNPKNPVDRIVLEGRDKPRNSDAIIYLDMGNRIKPVKPLLRKILPPKNHIIHKYVNIGRKHIPLNFFG